MPNVNVTERKVSPRLDQGLLTGLIAGAVVSVWMLLIGALGDGSAADQGVFTSSIVLGPKVFGDSAGFGANWLIGEVVHFVIFGLIGIVWALSWPRIRQYGTWTPALLFGIAMYVIVVQVIGRIIQPDLPSHLGFSGLWIGYILAGVVFAYRYRGA